MIGRGVGENKLSKPAGTKLTSITAIKDQLCGPCNKNLCFIKQKQVLNCKVDNLGKIASRFLFRQVLICGDLGGQFLGTMGLCCD